MAKDSPAKQCKPFLRWAGGKRWLAPRFAETFAEWPGRYVEPFLGSGAVFFALQPKKALLADCNEQLINCYVHVRQNCDRVVEALLNLEVSESAYYRYREVMPKSKLDQAVRFIYLNRTSFNGLYRVNMQGKYNVPYGFPSRNDLSWIDPDIRGAAKTLENADIICSDYRGTFKKLKPKDLVYCDPPYTVVHNNNGFIKYNRKLFAWEDQKLLATAAQSQATAKAAILISNAKHHELQVLYPKFSALTLQRRTAISGKSEGRKRIEELLFVSKKAMQWIETKAIRPHDGS